MTWYHRLLSRLPFVTIEERSQIIDPAELMAICRGIKRDSNHHRVNGKPHYIGPPGVMKPAYEDSALPETTRNMWRKWANERFSSPPVFPNWTCTPDSKAADKVLIRHRDDL